MFFFDAPMGNLCVCVLYRCINVMQRVIQLRKWITENNCIVLNKNNGFQIGLNLKYFVNIFKVEYLSKHFAVVFIKIITSVVSLPK